MRNVQCFKIKNGTNFDKAIKKHFKLRSKWDSVFQKVGELLGENITKMAIETEYLFVDINEIQNENNKKLFTKDGKLKSNSKRAKQILNDYKEIIKTEGLSEFENLSLINFTYGVMRRRGQSLKSFVTSEDDIYYQADFDLEKESNGLVIPISEIEYEEKYLEELKKRESRTA
ncbi:hypothetical protein KDN24_06995 [Bacillus sp. Bva_UNVM-123]|uniref:hypothetical protein n=1 Tax=Bacillus sp. Bva_UNVM-123 TaxID=2829798 RepID=UPI00391EFB9D